MSTRPTSIDPVAALPEHAPLDDIIGAAIEAIERGLPPTTKELTARFPEQAEQLTAFLDNYFWLRSGSAAPIVRHARVPRAGEAFGQYSLLGQLAQGGMGIVYRAKQAGLDREVALKVISGVIDKEDLRRFDLEARSMAKLARDCEYIVPIHDVGEVDGMPYYSMELIERGSLQDVRLEPEQAARLMANVARAIAHAHDHMILHRDLKPANILVSEEGEPRVTDFGLACRIGDSQRNTQSGALLGTAPYMSPEQASGEAKTLGASTDIWGLGAVLYYCLTGEPPFAGANVVETLENVVRDEPVPPRLIRPDIDPKLQAICLRCLAKQPGDRYASARAVAQDLDAWCNGDELAVQRVPVRVHTWRWCRRMVSAYSVPAFFLIAIVSLIGGVVALRAQRDEALAVQRAILDGNELAARLCASDLRRRLLSLSKGVLKAGKDERLTRAARLGDVAAQQVLLTEYARDMPYGSLFIVDGEGSIHARVSRDDKQVTLPPKAFNRMDYVRGARSSYHLYISKVYRGLTHDRFEFGMSIALDGPQGPVLVASIPVQDALEFRGSYLGHGAKVSLIGAYDPRPELASPPSHLVLVHEAYPATEPRPVGSSDPASWPTPPYRQTLTEYQDPLAARQPAYAGDWLVGIAPVGPVHTLMKTPFTVLVQRKYDGVDKANAALAREASYWRAALLWVLLGSVSVTVLIVLGLWLALQPRE